MKTGKTKNRPSPDKINFAIVRLPHVSNFTDLEVLEEEPDVRLSWLPEPRGINDYDVIVIPGSKCTISDMMWMKEKGWDSAIRSYMESKRGTLVGLCGGFQILGTEIRDPLEIEGSTKTIEALGLIDTSTEIEAVKVVKRSSGKDAIFNAYVEGYEIHMGKTVLSDDSVSFLNLDTGPDGAMNPEATVIGAYLHGLFDSAEFREKFLDSVARKKGLTLTPIHRKDYWVEKERHYDRLADHFSTHVDVDAVINAMR
jgi:adenosylcobyric acid synthase